MQVQKTTSSLLRVLSLDEIGAVSGADRFGYWVGKITVWGSPILLPVDICTGGKVSETCGEVVSDLEDWING